MYVGLNVINVVKSMISGTVVIDFLQGLFIASTVVANIRNGDECFASSSCAAVTVAAAWS